MQFAHFGKSGNLRIAFVFLHLFLSLSINCSFISFHFPFIHCSATPPIHSFDSYGNPRSGSFSTRAAASLGHVSMKGSPVSRSYNRDFQMDRSNHSNSRMIIGLFRAFDRRVTGAFLRGGLTLDRRFNGTAVFVGQGEPTEGSNPSACV